MTTESALRRMLERARRELLCVLDSISAGNMPHDGDDFHELLRDIEKVLALPTTPTGAIDKSPGKLPPAPDPDGEIHYECWGQNAKADGYFLSTLEAFGRQAQQQERERCALAHQRSVATFKPAPPTKEQA